MQRPNMIRPKIGKLPKTIVDRIPLVIYIPPPDGLTKEISSFPHIYPPTRPTKRRLRFRLLKSFAFLSSKPSNMDKATGSEDENKADSWVDNWEQGQYPFVTLDGNRAACAICLSDFEAPPRRNVSNDNEQGSSGKEKEEENQKASTPEPPEASTSEVITQVPNDERSSGMLKLEDAGTGPQPLRLLGCKHAFHVSPFLETFLTRRLLFL